MESFDDEAVGYSLLTTGATTSPSVWPQNWYWQKTKWDKEGGRPAACLMETCEEIIVFSYLQGPRLHPFYSLTCIISCKMSWKNLNTHVSLPILGDMTKLHPPDFHIIIHKHLIVTWYKSSTIREFIHSLMWNACDYVCWDISQRKVNSASLNCIHSWYTPQSS